LGQSDGIVEFLPFLPLPSFVCFGCIFIFLFLRVIVGLSVELDVLLVVTLLIFLCQLVMQVELLVHEGISSVELAFLVLLTA